VVPAVLPEVTAVGGTQFLDGGGAYWATTNSANFGSALSYIPEAAWNESGTGGLLASGGGVSNSIPKPAWQNGPGVPNDGMRDVPDISLTAAVHDSYLIYLQGVNTSIAGTSAGTPSMAGVLALLNQYHVAKGFQKQPGLGNINPQLYRLAQSVPSVFHDVTNGDTVVQCSQGSPDCLTGTIGYPTGAGYDMATGLGSIDAASLFAQWNSVSSGTTVNVIVGAARVTVDDTLAITAEVLPVAGKGTPTGTVSFAFGTTPLGTASLVTRNGQQFADIFVPVYLFEAFGSGIPITAQYSGDAAFSGSGGSRTISIVSVPGTAAVIPTYSNTIFPSPPDGQGPAWSTTIGVFELAGVPAMITGITLDGAPQKISDYTQSPNIPAGGSVTLKIVFRNLAAPVARTFTITGTDVNGNRWSRTFSINYNPPLSSGYFVMNATPLTVTQNTSADPSCQWAVQLNVDDFGGFLNVMGRMDVGNVAMNASQLAGLFGTDRMDAYGSLTGTVCYGSNVKPPTTDTIDLTLGGLFQQVSVSLLPPPANPGKLTIAPAAVSLGKSTTSTVTVNLSDKTQPWTAAIYPANRTTSWLTASQYSGTGSGQIVLTANPTGFEPGVYRATVVIQSPNTMPQYINVPVMFVLGGSIRGTAITAVASPADGGTTGAPGMSLTIYGTNLANTTAAAMGSPLAYSLGGVTATVNGLSAPLLFVSPTQVNIQIPYACGAGPAVVGINNNGEIAGISLVVAPSAPSIFADGNGFATGVSTVKAGAVATVYFTGAGEISPTLKTAYAPTSVASSLAYLPVQGVQVTVGGVPAFVLSTHLAVNEFGTMQVSFVVPDSLASGAQPVVVTVGKSASKPTNITVQ